MMIRLFAFFLFIAGPVFAQDFPGRFSVTGVAADDRLNIRAAANANASIIGNLSPFAINVEVLETTRDGRWGKVGAGENNGWVSMRFLNATPDAPNDFPRPFTCFGTEPFWSLNTTVRGDEYNAPDTGRRDLTMLEHATSSNGFIAKFQEGPTLNRTIIIRRAACNDGMSDRDYGWEATLFNEAPDGNNVAAGCCTMDTN